MEKVYKNDTSNCRDHFNPLNGQKKALPSETFFHISPFIYGLFNNAVTAVPWLRRLVVSEYFRFAVSASLNQHLTLFFHSSTPGTI
jgi:hypothetical protein